MAEDSKTAQPEGRHESRTEAQQLQVLYQALTDLRMCAVAEEQKLTQAVNILTEELESCNSGEFAMILMTLCDREWDLQSPSITASLAAQIAELRKNVTQRLAPSPVADWIMEIPGCSKLIEMDLISKNHPMRQFLVRHVSGFVSQPRASYTPIFP